MPLSESKWITKMKVAPLRPSPAVWVALGAAVVLLAVLIASARRKRSAGRRD